MNWDNIKNKLQHYANLIGQSFKEGPIETDDFHLYSFCMTPKRNFLFVAGLIFMTLFMVFSAIGWHFIAFIFLLSQLIACFLYSVIISSHHRLIFIGETTITRAPDEVILGLKIRELLGVSREKAVSHAITLLKTDPEFFEALVKELRDYYLPRIM